MVDLVEDAGERWVRWGFDPSIQPPFDKPGAWSWERPQRFAELGPQLLDRFLGIKPRGIPAFGKRWGVLTRPLAVDWPGDTGRAPLAVWASAQRFLDAILRSAHHLRMGAVPPVELLERVQPDAAIMLEGRFRSRMTAAQSIVFSSLNWQLQNVPIQLLWPGLAGSSEWGISLAPQSLWGALIVQTAHTILGEDALTPCSGCAAMHVRSRRRSDGVSYCAKCRDAGVPARLRKRRQRSTA